MPGPDPRRTVADLGEFATIERVVAGRAPAPGTVVGPGDDAAVLAVPGGRVVASTDMLVQGQHFRLDWSSARQVGRKAIAQNAADLAAMGASPTSFLVALGCPPDTPVAFVEELCAGLWQEAGVVGADVCGGDMVRCDSVVVSVAALGVLPGGVAPVLRSGARPGDTVAVAGRLGWSAAGLAVLLAGAGAVTPEARLAVELHQVPRPPYAAGLAAAAAGARAMTDVSDGLVADLRHLAEASGVAVHLDPVGLAPDPGLRQLARALGADAAAWVQDGGEDHALVAAFPPGAALPRSWRRVGAVAPADSGAGVWVGGDRREGGGWRSWG